MSVKVCSLAVEQALDLDVRLPYMEEYNPELTVLVCKRQAADSPRAQLTQPAVVTGRIIVSF